MNQQENISQLKNKGFVPHTKIKEGIVLKSKNGIAVAYNNGHCEGIMNQNVNENTDSINEVNLKESIGLLVLVGLSSLFFTTDITIVSGKSMSPTYQNHQIIIKSRMVRDINKILISKNAVVRCKSPDGDTVIKRIVGLPNDVIEFSGAGSLYIKINGKTFVTGRDEKVGDLRYSEEYFKADSKEYKKIKLKPNEYFLIGDNEWDSVDSRTYGPIEKVNILAIIQK